jgi:hypothetical protein
MTRHHVLRAALAALTFAALGFAPALAISVNRPLWNATYVAAYNPLFSGGVPYSGEMKIRVNHGIISGTYSSTSVRPDPLYGRTVNLTGTVQDGYVTLNVPGTGGFSMRGTLERDGTISGTATRGGRTYRFLAKVRSSP